MRSPSPSLRSPPLAEPLSSSAPRVCSLLPGIRVRDVSEACRNAALSFVREAHLGWGRRELAQWLIGPYAQATAATRGVRSTCSIADGGAAPRGRNLDEASITKLMTSARGELLEFLRSSWSWSNDAVSVRSSVEKGLVAGLCDERSDLGFGPLDNVGMGLVDRVRSLFIADYLTRSEDYETFAVCEDCEVATFDGGLYHVDCTRPRPRTVLRRRAPREVVLPADFASPDLDDVDDIVFSNG